MDNIRFDSLIIRKEETGDIYKECCLDDYSITYGIYRNSNKKDFLKYQEGLSYTRLNVDALKEKAPTFDYAKYINTLINIISKYSKKINSLNEIKYSPGNYIINVNKTKKINNSVSIMIRNIYFIDTLHDEYNLYKHIDESILEIIFNPIKL